VPGSNVLTEPGRAGRHVFPGFDALRLLAAVAVMFSHAFVIANADGPTPPDTWVYGVIYGLGTYAVNSFFIMSGFLLAGSLELNPSGITYAVNRSLRILPAYFFYVLILLLVIGPLVTAATLTEYFSSRQFSAYLRWGIDSFKDFGLPGVFNYEGSLSQVLNGSLWSLHYEALSYLFLLVVWALLRKSDLVAVFVVGLAVLTTGSELVAHWLSPIAATLPYFAGGVLMHAVYRRVRVNSAVAWISAGCFLAACAVGVAEVAFSIFGSYLIMFVGLRSHFMTAVIARRGDISYGMYLFGWPVEQVVRQVTQTSSPMLVFLISVPAAAVFAYASCHLVERPAMRVRRPVADALLRAVDLLLNAARASRVEAMWGGQIALIASGAFYLLSPRRSWYILSTLGGVAGATLVGALIAGTVAAFLHRLSRRRGAGRDSAAGTVN